MATVPIGVAGGSVTGQQNKGLPVLGGQAGTNGYSPAGAIPSSGLLAGPNNGIRPINTSPVASAGATGTIPGGGISPINTPPTAINGGGAMSGAPPQPIATQPTTGSGSVGATGSTPAGAPGGNNGNTLAGYTPQQTQQLQKQLTDIYGKGEGGLLFSLLNNLGSNDSSYMQAYSQALSKSTAEGLSTIDTGLGNAGISANSSTAAIEKGDYLSGVTTQEGLQEQQLIQTQQQEAIGLTQGLQNQAEAENSTSWLSTLAQVAGVGATLAGVPGASQGLSGLFASTPASIPTLSGGGGAGSGGAGAQLPGAISGGYAGPLPLSIG